MNFLILNFSDIQIHTFLFIPPGLKGLPGASSNRIVRLSVCLSVRLSLSVCAKFRPAFKQSAIFKVWVMKQ